MKFILIINLFSTIQMFSFKSERKKNKQLWITSPKIKHHPTIHVIIDSCGKLNAKIGES